MKLHTFSELDALIIKREVLKECKGLYLKNILKGKNSFLLVFQDKVLKISLHSNFYRMVVLKENEQEGEIYFYLEKILKNTKLYDVELPEGERIFFLKFRGISPLYEPVERTMVVEFLGRHRNILLTENKKIIWDWKGKKTGEIYTFPPLKEINIFSFSNSEWENYAQKYFKIYIEWTGIEKFKDLLVNIKGENPKKFFLYFLNDTPILPFFSKIGNIKEREFPNYSSALEFYYNFYEKKEEEEKRVKILQKINKREKETEIDRIKLIEEYRKKGELCLLFAKELEGKKGKFSLSFLGDEKKYEIELKEGETPLKKAEKYFEMYKKLKRKQERKFKRERREKNILEKQEKKYEFISPSGFKVLISRDRYASGKLVFETAKPNDLFFHIKDSPGPSVILKRGKTQKVPEQDILFAAKLAVKGKKGRFKVSVTEKKYLKPIKGKIGKVRISKEKIIWVTV